MTQGDRIIQYMRDFGSISALEAMRDLGVMRLGSRICELRQAGMDVIGEWETTKNRYGETARYIRYSLNDQNRP